MYKLIKRSQLTIRCYINNENHTNLLNTKALELFGLRLRPLTLGIFGKLHLRDIWETLTRDLREIINYVKLRQKYKVNSKYLTVCIYVYYGSGVN